MHEDHDVRIHSILADNWIPGYSVLEYRSVAVKADRRKNDACDRIEQELSTRNGGQVLPGEEAPARRTGSRVGEKRRLGQRTFLASRIHARHYALISSPSSLSCIGDTSP